MLARAMARSVGKPIGRPVAGFPGAGGFDPAALFANSEPGIWLDPSDLTTLFQDTAGTTPVTTPGQTVGLMLDKSGNDFHATQPTAAARPTYGIVPETGRRNLLTYTEQFDNVVWITGTAANSTRSVGSITINSAGGYGYLRQVLSLNAQHTFSVDVVSDIDVNDVGIRFADNSGGAAQVVDFTAGVPQRISLTRTNASATFGEIGVEMRSGVVPGVSAASGFTITFSYPQLEVGSTATDYQRVGSQFDVTEAGVTSLGYLSFDGVDDCLVTPTITPNTDKVQVFAGVRKLSDAAAGSVIEFGGGLGALNNSLGILAPASPAANYLFGTRTTTNANHVVSPFVAPISSVLSMSADLSVGTAAGQVTGRVNGTVPTPSISGTANTAAAFANAVAYIGRRGGTSIPFNGHIYSLITRFGPNLSSDVIGRAETYTAQKTGVTL